MLCGCLLVGLSLVVLSLSPPGARADDEAARTAELEFLAGTLWQAVVSRDVGTLLRYVDPAELESVRSRLQSADSGLSCALFDTACLLPRVAGDSVVRISVREFFRAYPNTNVRVYYMGIPGALGMESELDFAIVTWLVPRTDADRKFPAYDIKSWGTDHISTCLIHNRGTGWRFRSDVGIFFCKGLLRLRT